MLSFAVVQTVCGRNPRRDDLLPITPHALRCARREVKNSLIAYREARACVFRPDHDWYGKEQAIHAALEARFWWQTARLNLAVALDRPLVKGSHVSPNAKASLIARGIWKED